MMVRQCIYTTVASGEAHYIMQTYYSSNILDRLFQSVNTIKMMQKHCNHYLGIILNTFEFMNIFRKHIYVIFGPCISPFQMNEDAVAGFQKQIKVKAKSICVTACAVTSRISCTTRVETPMWRAALAVKLQHSQTTKVNNLKLTSKKVRSCSIR